MKNVMVLTATNRPENLRQLLESIKNQRLSLKRFKLYVNVEPVAGNDLIIQMLEQFGRNMDVDIQVNEEVLGIKMNTFDVCNRALKDGATSILYLEDDFLLSPDVLDIWRWYLKAPKRDIAMLCLFNQWGNGNEGTIHKSRAMMGWGWIMTDKQFEKYARPAWINKEKMWDTSIAAYIRTFNGVYNLFPDLSRASNTGRNGVHVNDQIFDKFMKDHVYNTVSKKFDYELTDEIRPHPSVHED